MLTASPMIYTLKKIDWGLATSVLLLIAIGLASLASSSSELLGKQILWVVLGLIVAFGLIQIDLRSFFSHRNVIFGMYFLVLGLLVITYLFAPEIKGNRAWLAIGSFQFQPSELAKVALIFVLAYFFSKSHIFIGRWKTIFRSFVYFALPAGLIAMQPDIGSASILFLVWFGFVLVSGIPLKRLAVAAIFFALAFVVMWTSVLKDYQKDRIVGVFQPERDPLGVNYSVIQAKIAIGDGGWFGRGFGQGTQVQLGFLPEAQNDFIFAAIAEEGGIVASAILLGAFLWMTLRILKIGLFIDGNFYKLVCLGSVILFCGQFILHVGSNLGLLPVIGVTLPFVSYGGSSIIVNLILIGVIESVYVRK